MPSRLTRVLNVLLDNVGHVLGVLLFLAVAYCLWVYV